MLRYHKQIYFPKEYIIRLKDFTEEINRWQWQYTKHCLDNIKYRVIDIESLLLFIKDLVLDYNNIFEFYCDELTGKIEKACYRITWKHNIDIILVVGIDKQIITIYLNSTDDKHDTLKEELYKKG